jgi:cell wall-associated protease
MKSLVLLLLIILFTACSSSKVYEPVKFDSNNNIVKIASPNNWHFKDIELDTVPGISLNRAYDSLLINLKEKKVIVAVLDNETDILHRDLKDRIWINSNEIPNNGIDDDKNGYIDDVNGWNFLGNSKGENNKYVSFETTRILKKLSPYFKDKDTLNLNNRDLKLFKYFKIILKRQNQRIKYFNKEKQNTNNAFKLYKTADSTLKSYFKDVPLTVTGIDSLKALDSHKIPAFYFDIIRGITKDNVKEEFFIDQLDHSDRLANKLLDLNYNDRIVQGDDENDLNDTAYGSNNMSNNVVFLDHGTKMSGVITGVSKNNEIEIMPVAISAYGDEHDKDIALAIRYAVVNGAKVINMSFGKEYSLYKEWVFDAIKFADKNDVLIVCAAGNSSYNLNLMNENYPNDNVDNGEEISDNFIMVGSSSFSLTKDLKKLSSNYGSIDVDLFAPGDLINTTAPKNGYTTSSGTSPAGAITSGVAALIRSYYPDLTASEVKHILMDSGVEYTLEVATPTEEDPEKTTPFNQLSKSGKVLNAYNALLMAERISKGKRKDK